MPLAASCPHMPLLPLPPAAAPSPQALGKPHVSALERAKLDAKAAAAAQGDAAPASGRKTQLQLDKAAATAAERARAMSARLAAAKAAAAAKAGGGGGSSGGGLEDLKPKASKLEADSAAWRAADA